MAPASDNVWVGDLPHGMDKGSLAALFEPYGTVVECRVLPGRDETAKPCAMIRFASVEMAQWVVDNINGNIPEGLSEPVICRFANDKSKGAGKGDKGGASWGPYAGGGKGGVGKSGFVAPSPSDNVWVGDLPVGTQKEDLATIFEPYGTITDCRMLPGRDATAKPCAMIRFASVEMAQWVVDNLNGNIPQGLESPIIARFANSPSKGAGKADNGAGWGGKAGGQLWGQEDNSGGWGKSGGKSFGKGDAGGKGKKGGAPGSFQALFQSVKGGGVLGGGTVPEECQIFIKNLPADTTDECLYKLFSPFGAIPPNGVKAMMDNATGQCKGIGFVDFSDPTAASTAVMALDGHEGIGVSTKKPSKGKGKGKDKGKGKWGGEEAASGW